jgi:hypothetical protein
MRGAISRSSAWITSLVSVPARFQNSEETLDSLSPASSRATMSVVEIGRFGVSGDGVDFRIMLGEGNLEGRGKIRIGDLFEFGQAEGGGPVKNGGCGCGHERLLVMLSSCRLAGARWTRRRGNAGRSREMKRAEPSLGPALF